MPTAPRRSKDLPTDCRPVVCSDLAAILSLDPEADEKHALLLRLHVHNYSYPLSLPALVPPGLPAAATYFLNATCTFCRQQSFSLRQISTLLGICQALMARDLTPASATDMSGSFAFFQSLLLAHSVDRPPKRLVHERRGGSLPLTLATTNHQVAHPASRSLARGKSRRSSTTSRTRTFGTCSSTRPLSRPSRTPSWRRRPSTACRPLGGRARSQTRCCTLSQRRSLQRPMVASTRS